MGLPNETSPFALGSTGGYEIRQSLRFDGSSFLSRSYGSTTGTTWTISVWLKYSLKNTNGATFYSRTVGSSYNYLSINPDSYLRSQRAGSSTAGTALYRDPSAWYHIVARTNDNGATAEIYVNNVEDTTAAWKLPLAVSGLFDIGCTKNTSGSAKTGFFDGYMAEYHYVESYEDPTDFGEFNSDGVWVPKEVTGLTYGTNGFYLDFSDPSDIGADRSGNGNDFTPTGFELTDISSALYDLMEDSPTNNWATYNSLARSQEDATRIIEQANLRLRNQTDDYFRNASCTHHVNSGRYYCEINGGSIYKQLGFCAADQLGAINKNSGIGGVSKGYSYQSNGNITNNGSSIESGVGAATSVNDTIGMDVDFDNQTVQWYVNGNAVGNPVDFSTQLPDTYYSIVTTTDYSGADNTATINFGQRPFRYPPGTTSPTTAFSTVLYTGADINPRTISGVGFEPDFVWVKNRSISSGNFLWDSVRGTDKNLRSNGTNSEDSVSGAAAGIISTNASDGFVVKNGSTSGTNVGSSGSDEFVAWCWNAGDGSPVTNNDGTIESTVKASPENGFSVVTYTGNGTAGATIGHNLGVTPSMIITKIRSATGSWSVYHSNQGAGKYAYLDTTGAFTSSTGFYGGVEPTSTVYTIGNNSRVNGNGDTYVAYCFADTDDRVKTGSYEGNTAGQAVVTVGVGFKPAMVLIKNADATSNWCMIDSERGPGVDLNPNTSDAEAATASTFQLTSSGFTIQGASADLNADGQDYIYIAFAENFTPGDANPLASANLEPVDIKDPSDHFQTILSDNPPQFPEPVERGEAYGGGFYAGRIRDGNSVYNIIVAPASEGDLQGQKAIGNFARYSTAYPQYYSTTYGGTGTFAYGDGGNNHFVADWAAFSANGPNAGTVDLTNTVGTGIGGFNDWYVPAIYELQLLYWAFKPTTGTNVTSSGANAYAIPATQNYTTTDPAQTTATSFQEGNANAFLTDVNYWSATQSTSNPAVIEVRSFSQGAGDGANIQASTARAVAIRREFAYDAGILDYAQATFPNGLWWIKDRANSNEHQLVDSVRGGNIAITTPSNAWQQPYAAPTGSSIAWCWSTDATGLNATAGFQIITYTGNGGNNAVPHSLGVAPEMFFVRRWGPTSADGGNIRVYTETLGVGSHLRLNSNVGQTSDTTWLTSVTDTHINIKGSAGDTNTNNDDYVVYAWRSVPGYSSIGSYVGNSSSNGPFVYCGFRPAFVLIKNTSTQDWMILDSSRDTYNPVEQYLHSNTVQQEYGNYGELVDFVSNGFKCRTTNDRINSGTTFIYAAFAEHPFGGSNVPPSPAR